MKKLKRYRQFQGLSRVDLAHSVGVSAESIARYERGDREPNATTVEKLAAALGITPNKLLGVGEDEKNDR